MSFRDNGFLVSPPLFTRIECETLIAKLKTIELTVAGSRNLLGFSWCFDAADRLHNLSEIQAHLPSRSVAVQCTVFEKTPDKNWLVPLHQDLSIPVSEKVEHYELSAWSVKEGITYVQPPVEVLDQLVGIRLHLDDCDTDNGALRVVPGSHRFGRLTPESAQACRDRIGETICPVPQGGLLLMRPLILHASSKSSSNRPRRVLHFLFGPAELPFGLKWNVTS